MSEKGQIAETQKGEWDNPTCNGDDFRPRTSVSHTLGNYEESQCTYIFVSMLLWLDWSYRYILWMIQYVVKMSEERWFVGLVVAGGRGTWDVGRGTRRSQHAVAMRSQQPPNPGRIPDRMNGGVVCASLLPRIGTKAKAKTNAREVPILWLD